MWEALGNSIKAFIEKDLVPSIISLAAGIITVLILPEDNWMVEKVGTVWIGVLAFALCFLLVKLLVVIAKFVKKRAIKRANKQYDLERDKEEEKEAIEKLWQSVDALSPGDRQTLKLLIENNNTPIEESSGCFYDFGSLFMSNWIVSTTVPYEFEDQDNQPVLNSNGIPIANFMNHGKKLYKLKDDVFQMLKYSKEKYGKISNFE